MFTTINANNSVRSDTYIDYNTVNFKICLKQDIKKALGSILAREVEQILEDYRKSQELPFDYHIFQQKALLCIEKNMRIYLIKYREWKVAKAKETKQVVVLKNKKKLIIRKQHTKTTTTTTNV